MFLRRKQRPQEDDSLVPHGLIWHATAENSAREQTPVPADATTAKILAMPTAPAAQDPAPGDVAAKKPPRGVAPFWRSLPAAEPNAAQASTHRAPLAPVPIRSESVPVPIESIQLRKESTPVLAESAPVQSQSARAAAEIAPVKMASVRLPEKITTPRSFAFAQKARELLASALVSTRSRLREALRHGQENAKRAEVLVVSYLEQVRERSGRLASSSRASLSRLNRMRTLKQFAGQQATRMGEGWRRRMDAIHGPVRVNLRIRMNTLFAPVIHRVRAVSWHPPTLRFKGFATEIEVLAAREVARLKLRWPELARGREFAVRALPLTLPALLMLGVFFAVRHYAALALPSHMHSATPAEYRPTEPPAQLIQPRRHRARAPQAKDTRAPAAQRHQTPALTRNARAQAAAQGGDDYVAPDTYVYYGPNGKGRR